MLGELKVHYISPMAHACAECVVVEDEQSCHHVAVVSENGSHILASRLLCGSLALPRFEPLEICSCELYCSKICALFGIDGDIHVVEQKSFDDDDEITLVIVELLGAAKMREVVADSSPAQYTWTHWELGHESFDPLYSKQEALHYLKTFLSRRGTVTDRSKYKQWYALGYYSRILPWIEQAVESSGLALRDTPKQLHFGIRSVLYKISTQHRQGGGVIPLLFKASPKGSREAVRSQAISSIFQRQSPEVLAINLELEAMLMQDAGPSLGDLCFLPRKIESVEGYADRDAIAISLLKQWAQMQQASISHIEVLRNNLPYVDTDWFTSGLEELVLFVNSEENAIASVEQETWDAAFAHLRHAVVLWERSEIPFTLVHGDLIESNVAQPDGPGSKCVFFDWDFACISYPFLDVQDSRYYPMWESERVYYDCWTHYAEIEIIEEVALWTKPLGSLMMAITEMRRPYMRREERSLFVEQNLEEFLEGVLKRG